jgi:hypothetical protein
MFSRFYKIGQASLAQMQNGSGCAYYTYVVLNFGSFIWGNGVTRRWL